MAMRGNRLQEASPWGWAWSGMALGVLSGVVAFAPARWVAASVLQASNQQVALVNPRGTLWQGSAQLVFSGGAGSQDAVELPGLVHWSVVPRWQGLGRLLHAAAAGFDRGPRRLGHHPPASR